MRNEDNMIEPEDLRLGNFIYNKDMVFPLEVHAIVRDFIHASYQEHSMDLSYFQLKPIPLNEEWLLSFGFTKVVIPGDDEIGYSESVEYELVGKDFFLSYMEDDFSISISDNKDTILYEPSYMVPGVELFKYVHQLQNLYYVLSGHELKIVETNGK